MLSDKIQQLYNEINGTLISNTEELEQFRLKHLSKKGTIQSLFSDFKHVPSDDKKLLGQKINELKLFSQNKFSTHSEQLQKTNDSILDVDYAAPGESIPLGARHPLSIVRNQVVSIFSKIGFTVAEGPEIEDDWHVFSGLNFPVEHPARDMQDTFFIQTNPDILLRTHTSSVQVRVMERENPPIRQIFPGRVFRNESISARSHCIFHQVEGLYIDTNVSFSDLKQCLLFFAQSMFGESTIIRLRPSFFPFTEPSAELDISCTICGGSGCTVCKYTGFVEILGCGMVDPSVLDASSIDSKIYTGYAFGMGIERIAMLKYQINDIRLFFDNDIRFLQQFSSSLE